MWAAFSAEQTRTLFNLMDHMCERKTQMLGRYELILTGLTKQADAIMQFMSSSAQATGINCQSNATYNCREPVETQPYEKMKGLHRQFLEKSKKFQKTLESVEVHRLSFRRAKVNDQMYLLDLEPQCIRKGERFYHQSTKKEDDIASAPNMKKEKQDLVALVDEMMKLKQAQSNTKTARKKIVKGNTLSKQKKMASSATGSAKPSFKAEQKDIWRCWDKYKYDPDAPSSPVDPSFKSEQKVEWRCWNKI